MTSRRRRLAARRLLSNGADEELKHMDEMNKDAADQIAVHRARIDEIDCQLVQLLNERAAESLAIRGLKPQVHWGLYDPKREEEIFANLARCNKGPLFAENLKEIYEAILHVMKELRG